MPLFGGGGDGPTQGQVYKIIEDTFKRKGWKYVRIAGLEHILTGFDGVAMALSFDEARRTLLLRCPQVESAPDSGDGAVPADRVSAICRYLVGTNYGLLVGGFSRDDRDGEIAYTSSIPLMGGHLSEGMLLTLIAMAIAAVQAHKPKITELKAGSGVSSGGGVRF